MYKSPFMNIDCWLVRVSYKQEVVQSICTSVCATAPLAGVPNPLEKRTAEGLVEYYQGYFPIRCVF